MSVTFSMRMEAEEKQVIADFAKLKNQSMAEFMIEAALEKIEDEFDLQAFQEALETDDGVRYTMEEVMQMAAMTE